MRRVPTNVDFDIVEMRVVDQMTLETIGYLVQVGRERVRQREAKTMAWLRYDADLSAKYPARGPAVAEMWILMLALFGDSPREAERAIDFIFGDPERRGIEPMKRRGPDPKDRAPNPLRRSAATERAIARLNA